jgi:UPF0755 protein
MDFSALVSRLDKQGFVRSTKDFEFTAKIKKFNTPKPGRYRIMHGMSNNELVNMLRIGNQEPVLVKLDGIKNLPQMAGRLASYLEKDSASFAKLICSDSLAEQNNLTIYTLPSLFFANSYELFWNTTPESFIKKMSEQHQSFWTQDRLQKCTDLGMTPAQVYTLASIVQSETAKQDEAPKVAGLYLNRLRQNKRLEADPTVIFATGLENISRVLLSDTQVDSPYNTYKHTGLPPGPICIIGVSYIDAVLNADHHNYVFMCAQPGNTGYHNFAVSYDQHLVYQREYTKWLDTRGITR